MNKSIENYYVKYNYISNSEKLYKLMKADNINVSKDDIKTFLNSLQEQQLTKQTKKSKKHDGHIVAFLPYKSFQFDIFDLNKYSSFNEGYKYIFAMVDIFSRFAFCIPMKTKNDTDNINALTKILDDNDLTPDIITSDCDSAF
jgi:hypothetical protein